jgi:hypothetical protein
MTMATVSSSVSYCESQLNVVTKLTKSYYQGDQQVKFMNLQAEVDSLLQQLQSMKNQKLENNLGGSQN